MFRYARGFYDRKVDFNFRPFVPELLSDLADVDIFILLIY